MLESTNPEDDLFEAALLRSPGPERAAFLDAQCRSDPELRARVEMMLEGHLHAKNFLETLPNGIAPRKETASSETAGLEQLGSTIGPYKLLQKLGEGGCGLVYLAEQNQPVRRRVALKVIKLGMDTRSVIARFEAERQALALMDHPNIAKVFDAGVTETGRPYFVMELVRGIRISEYCALKNLQTASDPKEFSPRKLALPHGSLGIVDAVAFTPDGQTMLSAGSDNNITLWDLSGRWQPLMLMGHGKEIFSIDVTSDGRTLASGGDDRKVKLWDISSRWRDQPKMSHGEWIFAVAISPDSKFVASLSPKKLRLWNAATEELLADHPLPQGGNGHLAFSPNSNILAVEDNGTLMIRLLKVPSFEEIASFRGCCPLFSPNGAELVYYGGKRKGIHWRDLKTQEERVWKAEWDWVERLAMSPDGRSIAVAKGRIVWIWKANAPDHPVEIEAPAGDEKLSNQGVWDTAFSPDGHWLANANWDGRVRLWNIDNPQEIIQPLKAHSGSAWAVAFSPDGRTLATSGNDATIKLWNLASRQQTATLRGHTGPVNRLAFSRDGTLLASCSGDGTARLWRAPTLQEIERAENASQPQKLEP